MTLNSQMRLFTGSHVGSFGDFETHLFIKPGMRALDKIVKSGIRQDYFFHTLLLSVASLITIYSCILALIFMPFWYNARSLFVSIFLAIAPNSSAWLIVTSGKVISLRLP